MAELVDNDRVRRAVAAFAAEPKHETMLDVLRARLTGELLLDVTGSELDISDGRLHTGSKLRINQRVGPDGQRALLAFTSNDEIARIHPEGTRYQSIAQPAAAVLELARRQGAAWLYIDPAEKTAALSASDIDFALRHPRNDRLSAAIAAVEAGTASRAEAITALVAEGPLLLAGQRAEGQGDDEPPQLRVTRRDDGSSMALLAFTSAPEILARDPQDGIVTTTTTHVLEQLQQGPFASIVINPAGPWIELSREELVAAG